MKILISLVFLLITTSSFAVTFEGKFIKGSIIKAIERGDYSTSKVLKAAKGITRKSIKYHLSGKELNTKKVFRSINKYN